MAEWISVEDRMPTKIGRYIVCAISGGRFAEVTTVYGSPKQFYMTGKRTHWKVTHWMELPQPPKGIKFNEF